MHILQTSKQAFHSIFSNKLVFLIVFIGAFFSYSSLESIVNKTVDGSSEYAGVSYEDDSYFSAADYNFVTKNIVLLCAVVFLGFAMSVTIGNASTAAAIKMVEADRDGDKLGFKDSYKLSLKYIGKLILQQGLIMIPLIAIIFVTISLFFLTLGFSLTDGINDPELVFSSLAGSTLILLCCAFPIILALSIVTGLVAEVAKRDLILNNNGVFASVGNAFGIIFGKFGSFYILLVEAVLVGVVLAIVWFVVLVIVEFIQGFIILGVNETLDGAVLWVVMFVLATVFQIINIIIIVPLAAYYSAFWTHGYKNITEL